MDVLHRNLKFIFLHMQFCKVEAAEIRVSMLRVLRKAPLKSESRRQPAGNRSSRRIFLPS